MSKKAKLATAGGIPVAFDRSSLVGHLPLPHPVRSFRARLRRVRWGRFVKRVALAVALVWGAYVVVANVLLRTRLLRNAISGSEVSFAISANTSALNLDYASAYSVIPGHVHLEGLTIRGRERTVEWFLSLDHADVELNLLDLLRRELHATRLRSSGFAIRARLRLDPSNVTPEVVAALPPIEGFTDPPLLDVGPEVPPLTDATYKLWTIHLEDVDVEHVREVWIHTIRSEGDTHVYGRWLFHPQRWLDVGPATVDANGVDISYGSQPLATGVRGSFGATIHPFDLRQADGLAFFDHVSYHGRLGGRAIVAGALRLLAPTSGLRFTRWEGPFDGQMTLDHGRFADGTRVRVDAPDSEIEAEGLAFEGPIRTDLGVEAGLGTLATSISGLRVSRLGAELARVGSMAAAVTSRHLEIAHAFDDAAFTLDVGDAETADVGAWKHYFPSGSGLTIRSGKVTADAHADGSLAEKRGRANLRLLARRLSVERGSDRLSADVTGTVQLSDVSVADRWAVGSATISADDVAARLGPVLLAGKLATHVELRRATWEGRTLDLSGSHVALQGVSARSTRTGAAILAVPSLTGVAPRLVLAPSGVDGHASLDVPRADFVHLAALSELVSLPKGLTIERGSGRVKLHTEVDLGAGSMRGDGEAVAWGIHARAGSTEVFGDVDCVVRARGAGGATDLSGSTCSITRAGTGKGAPPEDAWWAKIALPEATLRTTGGVRFDAKAHLAAKDATPATVLVSENTSAPAWATNIFRMPVLDASAEVLVAPASFEVRTLVAHGGSTSVRAEYTKREGRQDGAVLMDLGWIDLAYDLTDGATGLVLIGPEAWYQRKTATMRDAALAARRKTEEEEQAARYAGLTPVLRMEEAKALAARCRLEVRSCDGAAFEGLLRTASEGVERDSLSGIAYAPMVIAAAKGGKDGATLDPLVVGAVAEALKLGGMATLDLIPQVAPATDSDDARGRVITVTGRISSPVGREGANSVGTLTTEAEPVYFVTPFATTAVPEAFTRFRGVFVQRYAPANRPRDERPSLVLVGAFGP